jgi:hypothetical protein
MPKSDSSHVETSLASFEVASVVLGYRALSVLTQIEGLNILEASVFGGGHFLIMAQGREERLHLAAAKMRSALEGSNVGAWIDHEVVQTIGDKLAKAVYSLLQTPLSEALVIIECETISGLLAASHTLMAEHKLKPIEIKISRTKRGGYGFFTGTCAGCNSAVFDVEGKLRSTLRQGQIEVIENPPEGLRAFF